ncbi:cytochrome c biogenesis protein [Geothermobacter ehrlichii]|uniref:Cytochrome c biogenesis protein n=1 Tax=Geothermobacter ehrlichii TaxID=213224 RepID=A0A5D3WJ28_9BACT|nr:cytochrome c biogenesis protein ResB [Geothermobacter ehrlichii]TYO98933.1 cytochrome c biogenesis protein [Geothermobacter ehrlichii]
MLKRLLDSLASLKLTMVLLLGLATVAVFGTIWPSRDSELPVLRYELFYQTPWFRLLLGLLALNLTVCSLRLLRRRFAESERFFALSPATERGVPLPAATAEELAAALAAAGYRTQVRNERLLGWRGRWRRFAVLAVHGALLVVMAGALIGGLGYVATLNIYVGDSSSVAFDWDLQRDRPLGFTLRLDAADLVFYPIDLRIGLIDPATGGVVREYTTREGESLELPVAGYRAEVARFDPFSQTLTLKIYRHDRFLRDYVVTAGVRNPDNRVAGYVLYPLAFRDPVLKQYRSRVSILEGGKLVRQGTIAVNHPLVHRGVAIYQTAYNRDRDGRPYAGFQFSRDPGEPLVWAGCILFILALLAHFSGRPRAVLVVRGAEGWRLLPLLGFSGPAGDDIARLAERLCQR